MHGYYLKGGLIGFSSEFYFEKTLYSYFIGLDYSYNTKYSLYNRILYDSISNGIEKKALKIVYGRMAKFTAQNTNLVLIHFLSPLFS